MKLFEDETLQSEYEKLTEKQKRFIDYYIETGNGTEACKRAGYSEEYARNQAQQNYAKLCRFIQPLLDQKQNERIASQDEILEYLTRVMRGIEKDQFNLDASIQDRTKCAELLGKRYGSWRESVKVEGSIPVIITGDEALED